MIDLSVIRFVVVPDLTFGETFMSDNTTFGSQFLEALDAASGSKNYNYAKRKTIRQMDRHAVLTQYGLSGATNAAEMTAEDAVQILQSGKSSELSKDEQATLLNSTLMIQNMIAISSD